MKINLRGFLIALGAFVSLGLGPALVSAQSADDTTVADAARKAREQKKNASKAVRTLTNDDLPGGPAAEAKPAAAPSEAVDGSHPAEGTARPEKKAADAEAATQERAEKKAAAEAALKQAKADLAESQGELNVLERKQALDSGSYYSKTDYSQDTAGKAALEAGAQGISDKKSQVEALKNKIAELQAEFEKYSEAESSAPAQPN